VEQTTLIDLIETFITPIPRKIWHGMY